MSRTPYPLLLTMALSTPGAAHALGLGDIHVDSNLNQPLRAQIDIIGATDEELNSLTAAVANQDAFQKFGAERPNFLTSAEFKVSRDAQHRPVLSVRSTEPFTEPLVNLLISMRWPNGELVREYTLLLDPVGFGASATPVATVITPVPLVEAIQATPMVPTAAPTVAPAMASNEVAPSAITNSASGYTVIAKHNLHVIARRAGARSTPDLHRMMIAIFRANPNAFDGNINRMHGDALLRIPPAAEIAAISSAEAGREVRAQMATWRLAGRPTPAAISVPIISEDLDQRVQNLEQSLHEMGTAFEAEHSKLIDLQRMAASANMPSTTAALAPTAAPASAPAPATATAAAAATTNTNATAAPTLTTHNSVDTKQVAMMAAAGGLLIGAFAALSAWARRKRKVLSPSVPVFTPLAADNFTPSAPLIVENIELTAAAELSSTRTMPPTPVPTASTALDPNEPTARLPVTVNASVDSVDNDETIIGMTGDTTINFGISPTIAMELDYNLLDLDATAQHVHMPSALNEPIERKDFKERRSSIVEVLRTAIEQEPHRRELRLKLLEFYYSAATNNRQGFLEVVQALASDREFLASGEWDKVAQMGRVIAPDDPVFSMDPDATTELSGRIVSAA